MEEGIGFASPYRSKETCNRVCKLKKGQVLVTRTAREKNGVGFGSPTHGIGFSSPDLPEERWERVWRPVPPRRKF
jgi:hypothetical protein